MSQIAYCPECDAEIRFGRKPRLGQQKTCGQCGEEVEVIGLRPLELDYLLEDEFDDEEDDFTTAPNYDVYELDEDWAKIF